MENIIIKGTRDGVSDSMNRIDNSQIHVEGNYSLRLQNDTGRLAVFSDEIENIKTLLEDLPVTIKVGA